MKDGPTPEQGSIHFARFLVGKLNELEVKLFTADELREFIKI